jgi:hypothetical protein
MGVLVNPTVAAAQSQESAWRKSAARALGPAVYLVRERWQRT